MKNYETITVKPDQDVTWIILNRGSKMNAVNIRMMEEIASVTDELAHDAGVKVVIVTGEGRAFCGGGDLTPGGNINTDELLPNREMMRKVSKMILNLKALPKPLIAAVNGPALGVGFSLALACDIVVASEKASFGYPNVLRGIHPDGGATYLLPRTVGLVRATDMLLTGRITDADEAVRIGVVSRLVASQDLLSTARQIAADLAAGASVAISLTKETLAHALEMDLPSVLELEARAESICALTQDVKEGMKAWVEKRKPVFRGE